MTHPIPETYSDLGTPELHAKHTVIRMPTEVAGMDAAVILDECLLDRLKLARRLGNEEQAERRYNIGIWLRGLFDRAGLRQRTTMAYSVFGQAGGPEELTDAEAWNLRCYSETLRAVIRHRLPLVEGCIHDRIVPNLAALIDGLDALADHREGRR